MKKLLMILLVMPLFATAQLPATTYFTKNQTTWLDTYVYKPLGGRITTLDNKVNANEVKRKADSTKFANSIVNLNAQVTSLANSINTLNAQSSITNTEVNNLKQQYAILSIRLDSLSKKQFLVMVDTSYITKLPIRFSVIKDTLILKN